MTDLVRKVTFGRMTKNENIGAFKAGDSVGVYVKIKEGEKERTQLFKGIVLKIQGSGVGRSFTVRKMSSGVGVEKTFPYTSPSIEKVQVYARGKVRRSRLFYLRELSGRAARITSTLVQEESQSSKKKKEKKAEKK